MNVNITTHPISSEDSITYRQWNNESIRGSFPDYLGRYSSCLLRFDKGEDEIGYEINWTTGASFMFAVVGDNYLEEMSKAL